MDEKLSKWVDFATIHDSSGLTAAAEAEFQTQDLYPTRESFLLAMPPAIRQIHIRRAMAERLGAEFHAARVAAKLSDVISAVAPAIQDRAKGLSVKIVRADPKRKRWIFQVTGGASNHIVKAKVVADPRVVHVTSADVKFTCDCGHWQYGGPEYHAKEGGYLLGKPRGTAAKPNVRDPDGHNKVCKHVLAVAVLLARYKVRRKERKDGDI